MSHGKCWIRKHLAPALLLASYSLFAQGRRDETRVRLPIEEGTNLVFMRVPLSNGSSHTTVTQIASDQLGFLWFGTNDGLKRYDGYRIRDFRPDSRNRNSVSGLWVEAVFRDRSGMLWVASDLSIDRYDPTTETFTHYPPDPRVIEGPIHHVNQDREGFIWLATSHGLTRIDPASGKMTRYLDLMTAVLRSTFEQKDGTFWVASKESVDIFDRRTGEITQRMLLRDPAAVRAGRSANPSVLLFEDHAGVVWIASERDGLATIDLRQKKLNYFALAPGADRSVEPGVRTIHEDQHGVLWVGTDGGGLLKLERDRKKFVRYRNDPDDPESLCSDRVRALFEDQEGGIWVGTVGGGVVRFPSRPPWFRRYQQPHSNADYVSSAYEDRRGNIWVGSRGVVNRIDLQTGRFTPHRLGGEQGGFTNSDVFSIVEDRSGKLWFAAWGAGLHRFDPQTREWKTYRHKPDDPTSLGQDSVFALLIDHLGRLWVGTENGLNAFDPKTERFQVYRVDALGANRERDIAEDSHGTLWLATLYTGVHRFDPATKQFTVYRHSDEAGSLSNDAVAAIYVDRSGIVWAGTADGLNRFDPASAKFTAYYQRDGISGSSVTGIQEDERGDLWVTTNNGLSRLDRRTNTFQNYYRSDGVPDDLTSIWKGQSGNMLVGSNTGLISFHPDDAIETQQVAPVVLTNFELSDMPAGIGGNSPLKQSISFTKSLTLSHKQRIFSFEFAALSYASPAQTEYRYKLEGLEAGWNEVDATKRSARYTTLAARDYVFRVQSRTNRGAWSKNGGAVRIRILPAWWNTWPARVSWALASCLVLWAAYRLRVRQVAGQLNLRFEERLMERTRIAGELHDTLLQGFLSASMQLDVAADRLQPDSPIKPQLSHILELMSRVSAEGRNALLGLRSPDGNSMRLEQAFAEIEQEFAGKEPGTRAVFRVAVEGRSRPLHPVFRDEVYRIGREATINAFRHSGARIIEVEIEYSKRQFRLVVRDDGRGIDPQVLQARRDEHWGLRGMRQRSERIGARLRVWSRAERGTTVEMCVPGHIAFRSPQQREHARHIPIPLGRRIIQHLRSPIWLRVNTEKVVRKDSEQR
jgi:ligand-binding sensor domain-containing protein/signal transduction histidine kinase